MHDQNIVSEKFLQLTHIATQYSGSVNGVKIHHFAYIVTRFAAFVNCLAQTLSMQSERIPGLVATSNRKPPFKELRDLPDSPKQSPPTPTQNAPSGSCHALSHVVGGFGWP